MNRPSTKNRRRQVRNRLETTGAVRRALAAAGLLALVGAACAGDDVLEFPEAQPGASPGGTLRVGINEPLSIDPPATDALEPSQSLVNSAICDTLVSIDPVTGEVRPGIADSWQIGDRGERLNIRLKRGVRFHNGREVVAEDVVFALSRVAHRDFASPVASIFQPVIGYDQVHGTAEVDDERQRQQFAGMRVVEPFSFEIRLNRDMGDFFRVLAHPASAPIPKEDVENDPDGFARQPICAGPYQMTEPWTPGDPTIRVERFEDYHGQNLAYTEGGVGYPDEIEFRIYENREAQVAAFEAGEIDVAHAPREQLEALERFGDDLATATTPTLEYIGLPVSQEPFTQRGLRIALSQALDRTQISEAVYGGTRVPARSVFPPALGPLHREDACGDHTPVNGDVAAARESLRTAGFNLEGETISLYFNDEFGHGRLVEEVGRQWNAAFGVEVEPVPLGWDAYLDTGLRQPGFEGPFRLSWSPQYPAPDRYITPLFDSGSIGQDNFTRFSDRDFDRLLEREARRAIAEEDQRDMYHVLENTVCGEMPLIPLVFGSRPYLINSANVGSALGSPFSVASGMPALRELFLR